MPALEQVTCFRCSVSTKHTQGGDGHRAGKDGENKVLYVINDIETFGSSIRSNNNNGKKKRFVTIANLWWLPLATKLGMLLIGCKAFILVVCRCSAVSIGVLDSKPLY